MIDYTVSEQRSTLQVPGHGQTGLIFMNTLGCPVNVAVNGEGIALVESHGTALMMPLPHRLISITAKCPSDCAGRVMKKHLAIDDLKTVAGMVNFKA